MLHVIAAHKLLVAVSVLCLGAVTLGTGVTTHIEGAGDSNTQGNANVTAHEGASSDLDAKAKAQLKLGLGSLGCGCGPGGEGTGSAGAAAGADAKAKVRGDDVLESSAHAVATAKAQAGDTSAEARAAAKVSDDAIEQNTHAVVQSGDNRVGAFNGLDIYPEQGKVMEHNQNNVAVGDVANVSTKATAEADLPVQLQDTDGGHSANLLCGC
jgi:hypothetical protein